jgi:hypothetical protein
LGREIESRRDKTKTFAVVVAGQTENTLAEHRSHFATVGIPTYVRTTLRNYLYLRYHHKNSFGQSDKFFGTSTYPSGVGNECSEPFFEKKQSPLILLRQDIG